MASLLFALLLLLTGVAHAQTGMFFNCGGPNLVEATNQWMSDEPSEFNNYVQSGNTNTHTTTSGITATMWWPVYKVHRYAASGDLVYRIPVRGALHEVKLLFAETFFNAPDKRRFTVKVNGQMWTDVRTGATDLDVYAKAGAMNRAVMIDFKLVDTTGEGAVVITLGRVRDRNHPMISGIVIDYQRKMKWELGDVAPKAVRM